MYKRDDVTTYSAQLDAVDLGVTGNVLRQRVKSLDGLYDLVFEITNDGPVIEGGKFRATETVIISKNNNVWYSATFATTGAADGATDLGVYRNCPLGAKLEILSATEGRITFCKK